MFGVKRGAREREDGPDDFSKAEMAGAGECRLEEGRWLVTWLWRKIAK